MANKKIEEQIRESTKIAQQGVKNMESQIDNLGRIFESQLQQLEGDDKQTVQELQASVNRVISIARKGGDYNKALEELKTKFT